MLKLIENPYLDQEIATLIVLLIYMILRISLTKLIHKFASINHSFDQRTKLIVKYIHLLLNILALLSIIIIWGVKKDQIFLFISSIFAVVGVASFAQWSILSNVTAGIIIFFSYPFKIVDKIKVHDKEHPVEGEIYDIKAFYMVLKSEDVDIISYTNHLIMQKGVSVIYRTNIEKEFFD